MSVVFIFINNIKHQSAKQHKFINLCYLFECLQYIMPTPSICAILHWVVFRYIALHRSNMSVSTS